MTGVIIGRVKNQKRSRTKNEYSTGDDGKEDYIELLRAGDPDESRIRKLLEKGELFLLEEHGKLRHFV